MKHVRNASVFIIVLALFLTPLFGNRPMLVVSGSMEPAVSTGALILVHFCEVEDCAVGDVVVYYSPDFGEYITHRVVETGEDFLITRGDANSVNDPTPVIGDMLYGKVILTMNFLAPLMSRFIQDRAFDRGAMVGAILTVFVALSILVWLISAVLFLGSTVLKLKQNRIYSSHEESMVRGANDALEYIKSPYKLSLRKRVRLYIAYSRVAQDAEELSDLLSKYVKEG